jgi:hypothetical protein
MLQHLSIKASKLNLSVVTVFQHNSQQNLIFIKLAILKAQLQCWNMQEKSGDLPKILGSLVTINNGVQCVKAQNINL